MVYSKANAWRGGEMNICLHCNQSKDIRNPSGFCDHLYYPESCPTCSLSKAEIQKSKDQKRIEVLESRLALAIEALENTLEFLQFHHFQIMAKQLETTLSKLKEKE